MMSELISAAPIPGKMLTTMHAPNLAVYSSRKKMISMHSVHLIDVEYWTNNLDVAMDYLKLALGYYPTSEVLMIKKAKIFLRQGEKEAAALSLRRVLDLNPGNKEAIVLLNSMSDSRLSNRFSPFLCN